MATTCRCAGADHQQGCPRRWVDQQRVRLYVGLYDAEAGRRRGVPGHVRLLNAGLLDDDPTARRFALLEID